MRGGGEAGAEVRVLFGKYFDKSARPRRKAANSDAVRYTTHILTSYKSPAGKLQQCEIDREIAEKKG